MGIQIHTSGPTTPWGIQRSGFYGIGGVPDVWVDGLTQLTGSYSNDQLDYNRMLGACQARWSDPTDVVIAVWGEQIEDATWLFTTEIGLEAGADPMTVRVHMVQVLFDYPYYADHRYNNCVRYGVQLGQIELTAGQKETLEHQITFDATSWASKDNIRVAVWAEKPLGGGASEVHQAEISFYPFPAPPDPCPWDFDDDKDIDTADLLFLLGAWGTPDGDVNDDGITNTSDLLELLAYWGECPAPPCPWDLNGDGVVDDADRDLLLGHWGDCPDPPEECPWDMNGDGVVDGLDLLELMDHYGPCPE